MIVIAIIFLFTACTTLMKRDTEARYVSDYVEYYCNGFYWDINSFCGYIRNIYNDTIYVKALWISSGSSPIWLQKLEMNETFNVFYYNDQVKYIISLNGQEIDLINPIYKEK